MRDVGPNVYRTGTLELCKASIECGVNAHTCCPPTWHRATVMITWLQLWGLRLLLLLLLLLRRRRRLLLLHQRLKE